MHSIEKDEPSKYVPLRLPHTLSIVERLPPGAAAVLLNQSHQFHDLFMLINQQEKQMFEAVDGKRSVLEIGAAIGISKPSAQKFFRQLWRYDQVVFDTSLTK